MPFERYRKTLQLLKRKPLACTTKLGTVIEHMSLLEIHKSVRIQFKFRTNLVNSVLIDSPDSRIDLMSFATGDMASYNRQTIKRLLNRRGGVKHKLSSLSKLERMRQQSSYHSVAGQQIIHHHLPPPPEHNLLIKTYTGNFLQRIPRLAVHCVW